MYSVLTLDLQKSKKYNDNDRINIQKYLIKITDQLNQIFHSCLLRNLRFSGGDELQGLFKDPASAFLCLRMFQRSLHAIRLHAGIGIGDWTTVIDGKDTLYQDGPAYHRARKAIDLSKKEKEYTAIICSGTNRDPILNSMLNSCFQLMYKNTEYQNELIILLECCYPIQSKNRLNMAALAALPAIISTYYHGSEDCIEDSEPLLFSESNELSLTNIEKKRCSPLQNIQGSILSEIDTDQLPDEIIFKNSHPFGAAKKIADVTGLIRQVVDKALQKSDIYTERAVAFSLLSELQQL